MNTEEDNVPVTSVSVPQLPGPSSNAGTGSNKPSRKRQHTTSEASSSNIHASEVDLDKKAKFS